MIVINSLENKIIKELARLKKTGFRKEHDLMIIDGAREISAAVASGIKIESLFYCPALVKPGSGAVEDLFNLDRKKIIEVAPAVFNKICYKENPDGFMATANLPRQSLSDIKLKDKPLIIILERIEKPGNLGAILRTATAVSASAVIINNNQTDIYSPNVIRASEGYVFSQLVVQAPVAETIKWLKDNKIKSFAAATSGAKKYTAADLNIPAAIVLGSEADGLSPTWLKEADELIKIPMPKGLDSLNVSVAAAVIAFEVLRQRSV